MLALVPAAAVGFALPAFPTRADCQNVNCSAVVLHAVRLVDPQPKSALQSELGAGIYVSPGADLSLTEILGDAALAGELRRRVANTTASQFTAYAFGPEIAAEDVLDAPTARYTKRGVAVTSIVRLAVPPGASARRRIVWRPVLALQLEPKRVDVRLEVEWVLRGPDGQLGAGVMTIKEIVCSARGGKIRRGGWST